MRKPTDQELAILNKLLSVAFQGSDELRKQLAELMVEDIEDEDACGSIYLHPTHSKPIKVEDGVPVTGSTKDDDEAVIDVLLHIKSGYLHELEFVKYGNHKIVKQVKAEHLTVKPESKPL